jgi:hypothetical protein
MLMENTQTKMVASTKCVYFHYHNITFVPVSIHCGNLTQGDGLVTTLPTSIAVADARTKACLSYAPVGQ